MKHKRTLVRLIKSSQFKNSIWLYVLRFFQLVVPLITFPYVTRVLGNSAYGAFSIALNLITYLQTIVEYGFDYSGSRRIALAEKKELSGIYTSIISAKMVLLLLAAIIMMVILQVPVYSDMEKTCVFFLFCMVIGTALQQTWVFQGFQEMQFITIANVIARSISVLLVFMFVNGEDDVWLYAILYSSSSIISGIISIIICKYRYRLKYRFAGFKEILLQLKEGFSLFLTAATARILSTIGMFFLGLVVSEQDAGIYSAAQKIPSIMIMCYTPISQAMYPYISKLFVENKKKATNILKILYGPIAFGVLLICILVMLLGEKILLYVCGPEYLEGEKYIRILMVWVWLSVFNNILGTLTLVASGRSEIYSKFFVISAIVAVVLNILLIKKYSCIGAAIATMISEGVLFIIMLVYILKNHRKIFVRASV